MRRTTAASTQARRTSSTDSESPTRPTSTSPTSRPRKPGAGSGSTARRRASSPEPGSAAAATSKATAIGCCGRRSAATTTSPGDGAVYDVDLAAPDTTVDPAPALTRDATPTFTFRSTEPGTFRCSLDRGTAAFASCAGASGTHTPTRPVADGTYTFRVAAADTSGNVDPTPATRTVRIDATAPNTRITSHPGAKFTLPRHRRQVSVVFRFAASEPGSTFRCRLDRGTHRVCGSPLRVTLRSGRHTLSVVATDVAGNTDPSAARFSFVAVPSRRHGSR
jgi:hypothetical protein